MLELIKQNDEDTGTKSCIMLAVCSKSAEKFISAKRFEDMQEIELTVDNKQQSDLYEPQSISTVYNCIYSTSKDASAVYVTNGDEGEDDMISGTAMFSGEKMTGLLDGDETAIVKAIHGKMKAYPIVVGGHEYIVSSKRMSNLSVSGNTASISVYLSCTVGGKSIDKLPDNVREVFGKRLSEVMVDMITAGSDVIGLGQIAARQYANDKQFENSGGKQKYKAMEIKTKLVA